MASRTRKKALAERDVAATPTRTRSADPPPMGADVSLTKTATRGVTDGGVIKSGIPELSSHINSGLSADDLRWALRLMMLSRRTDEKHLMLLKQGKSFFHIGASGHEAVQIGIGRSLRPDHDWAWTYYRDLALAYVFGHTPEDHFLGAFSKAADPASGGRQMPCHHGNAGLNLPTQSSPTGTQFLNAVGCALASRMKGTDEVTYVAAGEGTTSQGEFYEAVNWASREKLAVVFVIQDNGYAISVPASHQTAGGRVGELFTNHPNLNVVYVDGTDFIQCYAVGRDAVDRARRGDGPTLIHARVVRLLAHSSSDDQRKYRPLEELEAETHRDPIPRLSRYLIDNRLASQEEIDALSADIHRQVDLAADWALEQPDPDPATSLKFNLSPRGWTDLTFVADHSVGEKVMMVDAINHAMHEELARNDSIVVFGEDVAGSKGGVFTATRGLTRAFGQERVFNSPLAEASIVGVALGLAVRGYKPCVEIQFGDYIWPAFMQIRNEVATLRYRSNNAFSCPMVIRVAVGGYIHGGLYHSQNIEALFAHIPGLLIAYPSTSADAKGLLKAALRMDDPVIFCEHKGLYRSSYSATPEPSVDYLVEFGKGRVAREGKDLTTVTWGAMVKDALNAARRIEAETGYVVEVIDLRTIVPWDRDLVIQSVARTGKLLVVHEDSLSMGFGAEIAATIAHDAFQYLDAPVDRIAAKDSHIPYSPSLEDDVLPNEEKIRTAMLHQIGF